MKRFNLGTFGILIGVIGLVGFFASCTHTTTETPVQQSRPTPVEPEKPIIAHAPVPAPAPPRPQELAIRKPPPPSHGPAPSPYRPPSIIDNGPTTTAPASSSGREYTYVSYKSFLTTGEPITTRPYSFVYFSKPPTTTKLKQQYILICQMYMDTFSDKEETETYFNASTEKLIPVFWFSKKKKDDKNCETLIKEYDYQRVRSLINKEVKPPPTPSLVARFGKYSIVMELDGLDNQEDLDMAFSTWKDKITRFPEKDYDMTVISLVYSAKKVLGVFGQILYYTKS